MYKSRIAVIVLIFCLFDESRAQSLDLQETINYIVSHTNKHLLSFPDYVPGTRKISMSVEKGSIIQIKYFWLNNESVLFPEAKLKEINYNLLNFNINDIYDLKKRQFDEKYTITLSCKNNTKGCFKLEEEGILWYYSYLFSDRPSVRNQLDYVNLFYFDDEITQQKIFNAFEYLFEQLKLVKNKKQNGDAFLRSKDDPLYGKKNEKKVTVNLVEKGGVSTFDINLAGIIYNVILDSGASDVSIPRRLEQRLLASSSISSKNYLSSGLYQIADGSVVSCNRLVLPYIKIGNVKIKNVQCSVNKSSNMVLLGQAFLERFKSWKIDNNTNQLTLEY